MSVTLLRAYLTCWLRLPPKSGLTLFQFPFSVTFYGHACDSPMRLQCNPLVLDLGLEILARNQLGEGKKHGSRGCTVAGQMLNCSTAANPAPLDPVFVLFVSSTNIEIKL